MLWFYFIYFFRKKKKFLSKTRGEFTATEKAVITWTLLVLVSNTINFAFDNVLDVLFLFITNWESFEDTWNIFLTFWFYLLVLNNGMSLLFLYRHIAKM